MYDSDICLNVFNNTVIPKQYMWEKKGGKKYKQYKADVFTLCVIVTIADLTICEIFTISATPRNISSSNSFWLNYWESLFQSMFWDLVQRKMCMQTPFEFTQKTPWMECWGHVYTIINTPEKKRKKVNEKQNLCCKGIYFQIQCAHFPLWNYKRIFLRA